MILTRRSVPLVMGALLTALVLTGCGFDRATNRINQITHGTTDREGTLDIVHTLVVASAPDSGTLVGQLVNRDTETAHRLVEITGDQVEISDFDPVELPANGDAQLSDAGIRVDGDFTAGDYLTLTYVFDNDEERELLVPVVAACDEFEGLDDAPREGGRNRNGDESESHDCETAETPGHGSGH